jgi:hypothetical protein
MMLVAGKTESQQLAVASIEIGSWNQIAKQVLPVNADELVHVFPDIIGGDVYCIIKNNTGPYYLLKLAMSNGTLVENIYDIVQLNIVLKFVHSLTWNRLNTKDTSSKRETLNWRK